MKNLAFQFEKNKTNFEGLKCREFSHLNLEFSCTIQMKQCNLMLYEVYNCIRRLYEKGEILLYSYAYKNKVCTGICPVKEKDFLKRNTEVYEQNFLHLDMMQVVTDVYGRYINEGQKFPAK